MRTIDDLAKAVQHLQHVVYNLEAIVTKHDTVISNCKAFLRKDAEKYKAEGRLVPDELLTVFFELFGEEI